MLKRLETKTAPVDPKLLDTYVGEYEVTPTFKATVFKEGEKLMVQATSQPAFELLPDGDHKFFVPLVNAKVTFVRDEKGQVTGLVINQGGQELPGKKIK